MLDHQHEEKSPAACPTAPEGREHSRFLDDRIASRRVTDEDRTRLRPVHSRPPSPDGYGHHKSGLRGSNSPWSASRADASPDRLTQMLRQWRGSRTRTSPPRTECATSNTCHWCTAVESNDVLSGFNRALNDHTSSPCIASRTTRESNPLRRLEKPAASQKHVVRGVPAGNRTPVSCLRGKRLSHWSNRDVEAVTGVAPAARCLRGSAVPGTTATSRRGLDSNQR